MGLVGDFGGGQPGDVQIVFEHQGEQLLGGTEVQRVVEIGVRTSPSGVFFQFRLPARGFTPAAAAAYAGGFALAIEDLLTVPYIVDIVYQQDLSAGGNLLDQLAVYWQTEDEIASGFVIRNLPPLTSTDTLAAVDAAMSAYQVAAA